MMLKRRSLLLNSLALLASPARASISPVDLALLDAETVPYHCKAIARVAPGIVSLLDFLKDAERAPIARHIAAIAARTFQPTQTLIAVQARLATLPGPARTEGLVAAFNRYADAMDLDFPVQFGSREEIAGIRERYRDAMLARPDHAAISALTALTPNVAIGEEASLASRRLFEAVHDLAELDPAVVRALPRAEWGTVIDPLRAEPRPSVMDNMAEEDGVPSRINTAMVRASLSTLPAADVALLLAFYTSREGQARRAAIIEATQAQVDHDTRTIIMTYLDERYLQAEPMDGWYPAPAPAAMDPPSTRDTPATTLGAHPKPLIGSSAPRFDPPRTPSPRN